ncbi:unnamed protein product [Discosporangium mesarthrocarpum]
MLEVRNKRLADPSFAVGRSARLQQAYYAFEMTSLSLKLKKLRTGRRLPLTEAAYNGHYEVLQFFRLRRVPLATARLTWVYPSGPPPFAPPGHDGTLEGCSLVSPMSAETCAEAGARELGSKQYFVGRGWADEGDVDHRFFVTMRVARTLCREVDAIEMLGREEAKRRAIIRGKRRKEKELVSHMDASILAGYRAAPEAMKLCLEGISINHEAPNGSTILMAAAEEDPAALGHEWVRNDEGWQVLAVAFLLDRGINRPKIEHKSKKTNHSALTWACHLGRSETTEILVERGALINKPAGHLERTPLVTAAAAGHAEVVRLLLERGANPGSRGADGLSAWDVALKAAFSDVLGVISRLESGMLGLATAKRGAANPLVPCTWGCGKMVAAGEGKSQHEKGCLHREVECMYRCGAYRLQYRELDRHVGEVCPRRPLACSMRCGSSIPAEKYQDHQVSDCPMRPVCCPSCRSKVVASVLDRHLRDTCPERMVPCEQGCGERVRASAMHQHVNKSCPLKRVTCRLGCGLNMWLKMREEHEGRLCSERLIECKWGCKEEVKAKHLMAHESQGCPRIGLPCPNRCGIVVSRLDLDEHYASKCANRFVACGLGCGYKVRAKDLTKHESEECGIRQVACPRGCGEGPMPARAMTLHLKYDCRMRSVRCSRCQIEVPEWNLDVHKRDTCSRRVVRCQLEGCHVRLPAEDMAQHEARDCPRRKVWCLQGCGEEMLADARQHHHQHACSMRYVPCPLRCAKKVRIAEVDDHIDLYCARRHQA